MVLKGFINGAVSLELNKRSKFEQSKKIYKVYKKYTNQEKIKNTCFVKEFEQLSIFMNNKFLDKSIIESI